MEGQHTSFDAAWDALYGDKVSGAVWQTAPIPVIEQTIIRLQADGAKSVLDVGAGDGRNLAAMAAAGFQCAGLDISTAALQRAHQTLSAGGLSAIMIPGDCHALPVAPGTLDAITAFDVFGQLNEPERFLSSAHAALRPGGLLLLNAFTPDDSEYGQGDPIGEHRFVFKRTLFRFFPRKDLVALFGPSWRIDTFEEVRWDDPPHGNFRPYAHTHVNWWVIATREGL